MRFASRQYLIELLDEYYKQRQNFVLSVTKENVTFVKKRSFLKRN